MRKTGRVDRAVEKLGTANVRYVDDKSRIPVEHANSATIFIDSPKASILAPCPGSSGHLCCNYLTINLYAGCVIGCSYCIMKGYLNFAPITVNMAIERTIGETLALANANPDKTIRLGTGEVGDSLDLDPVFGLSAELIEGLAPARNVIFELKTKTDSVDHLLGIREKGNTVIGFSVNGERIAREEDGFASPLAARIEAAKKAVESGYRVSFHFDPVFRYEGWEEEYARTVDLIGSIDERAIAWISMGTFRYPKGLKEKIDERWFLYDEFVQCRDGKFRYIQSVRTQMYGLLKAMLARRFPSVPVYLCMESNRVWESVFGASPFSIPGLEPIFER